MFSFFMRRFEREQDQLAMLFECLEQQAEDISEKVLKLASHIVNIHHILLSDITNKKAESGAWDVFKCWELGPLSRENFRNTYVTLLDMKEHLNDMEDAQLEAILMKLDYMLQHSAYHRGQLIQLLKDKG
jgi:uncharacterized damage-inducible protein DinB